MPCWYSSTLCALSHLAAPVNFSRSQNAAIARYWYQAVNSELIWTLIARSTSECISRCLLGTCRFGRSCRARVLAHASRSPRQEPPERQGQSRPDQKRAAQACEPGDDLTCQAAQFARMGKPHPSPELLSAAARRVRLPPDHIGGPGIQRQL